MFDLSVFQQVTKIIEAFVVSLLYVKLHMVLIDT